MKWWSVPQNPYGLEFVSIDGGLLAYAGERSAAIVRMVDSEGDDASDPADVAVIHGRQPNGSAMTVHVDALQPVTLSA